MNNNKLIKEMHVDHHPSETEVYPYGDGIAYEKTGEAWSGHALICPSAKGLDLGDLLSDSEIDELTQDIASRMNNDTQRIREVDVNIDKIQITISFLIQ